MRHHPRRPTHSRTDYQTHRPAPPAAATLALAVAPLAVMYLLTHPAVAATLVVAAAFVAVGRNARRG